MDDGDSRLQWSGLHFGVGVMVGRARGGIECGALGGVGGANLAGWLAMGGR